MKNKILIICIFSVFFQFCGAKKLVFNYEHNCNEIGTMGTKVIKVFTTGRNAKVAIEHSDMMAVHAFLFKNVVCQGNNNLPISSFAYNDKKEFFDDFFNSGKYKDFVAQSNNASIKSEDRRRMENGDVKIGLLVQVQYSALKNYMASKGICKTMGME